MAGDSQVNGTYGTQQPYGQPDNYTMMQASNHSGPTGNSSVEPASSMPASGAPSNDTEEKTPSKEEIGWFFVEQYYKTLCNEPSKLYLYYNKRSQFVSGDEAEKVLVAVGQKAISERIKELDIQDCKVRVLNVDSQEAQRNILVQVIGEISNKAEPHRKFVQTFVLAEQPSGYYVLNDIFRYIAWEEDEYENGAEANEVNQTSMAPKPDTTTLTSSDDLVQQEVDAEMLDRKLEENVLQKPSAQDNIPRNFKANGHAVSEAPIIHAEEIPTATVKETEVDTPSHAAAVEEEEGEPEKPHDPEPTPADSPPRPVKVTAAVTQAPASPAKPAAPKSWASLVGRAAAPNTTNGTVPAAMPKQTQPKPKTTPSASKPPANPQDVTVEGSSGPAPTNGNSEWQLADSKQRQNRSHSQSVSSSQANVLGYVKNVTEKVDASLLKAQLQTFGELNYFDVSRLKNCAFIEYADSAAYNAAVSANPHNIGGEQIFVEERRPRANAYGGNVAQRGGVRGGRGGNENFRGNNQGRSGFNKDGGRGGFNNRGGRGGSMPPKARSGQPQAA